MRRATIGASVRDIERMFDYNTGTGRSGASSNTIARARCVSYDLMRRALCVWRS